MATRHRVATDLRGHGESEKPHDSARYGDRLWRDVVELMDSLGIRREARDFTSVVLPGKSHRTAATPGFMPPEYIATLTRFIDGHDTPP